MIELIYFIGGFICGMMAFVIIAVCDSKSGRVKRQPEPPRDKQVRGTYIPPVNAMPPPVPSGMDVRPLKVAPVTEGLTTDRRDPGLREVKPNGQQGKYLVLPEEERAKGFVNPVLRAYRHLACGTVTNMGLALCETYARNPGYYSGTFCSGCGAHFDLVADDDVNKRTFVWVHQGYDAQKPDGTPFCVGEYQHPEHRT